MKKNPRVVISGGGTGGHIFPAVSIANEIKKKYPEAQILFVGAEGRMEMSKVPAAGYPIIGLPIKGFDRKKLWKNLSVLFLLFQSLWIARREMKRFCPDVAIGVGGYASGPTLWVAQQMGIPTLIQEQNSYAGITNKLLAKGAAKICVAYEGMERFFPKDRIVLTGNPVRQDLFGLSIDRAEALRFFGLQEGKKIVLVVGGSLGARTLNESVKRGFDAIAQRDDLQVLWQCGGYYQQECEAFLAAHPNPNIILSPFISRMDLAYAAADIIVSRAGASSISELAILGKPVILVPSPNVSEDHQTKNAMALVQKQAALLIRDVEAPERLVPELFALLDDNNRMQAMAANIRVFKKENAAGEILECIQSLF